MASFAETSFQFPASMNTNGFRMTNGFNEAVQSQQPQCGWLPNAPAKPLIVMNRMEWCQEDQSKEPTFTNGRKRSCDSLSLDDTKKVKTEVCFESSYPQNFTPNPLNGHKIYHGPTVSIPETFNPATHHQGSFGFPSSVIEHQSMIFAERSYDVTLLENLVAEFHGC